MENIIVPMQVSGVRNQVLLDKLQRLRCDALQKYKMHLPPDLINYIGSTKIKRFSSARGDYTGTDGWFKIFSDEKTGIITISCGSHKDGSKYNLSARDGKRLTEVELKQLEVSIEEAKTLRERQKAQEHLEKKERIREMWKAAQRPPFEHEYLKQKKIGHYGYELCLMSQLPIDGMPKCGKIYLEKQNDNLRYVLLSPRGEGKIESFFNIWQANAQDDLTLDFLNNKRFEILKITSERGHTLSFDGLKLYINQKEHPKYQKELLIPLYDEFNIMQGLQRVLENKKLCNDKPTNKFFMGKINGCFYWFKSNSNVFYVVEGYATGFSIFMATGDNVVVAFSCSQLLNIANYFKKKYMFEGKRIIVAGDSDDVGIKKLITILKDGFPITYPIFSKYSKYSDFNDLYLYTESYEDVCKQLISNLINNVEEIYNGIK